MYGQKDKAKIRITQINIVNRVVMCPGLIPRIFAHYNLYLHSFAVLHFI